MTDSDPIPLAEELSRILGDLLDTPQPLGVRALVAAREAARLYTEPGQRRTLQTCMEIASVGAHISAMSVKRALVVLDRGTEAEVRAVAQGGNLHDICDAIRARNGRGPGRRPAVKAAAPKPPKPAAPPPAKPKVEELPRKHHVPAAKVRTLTREQVDPEFTGTDGEFRDKYGHVWMKTAAEIAESGFQQWTANMGNLARAATGCLDWPEVDLHWLRQVRQRDVDKLRERLALLRPKVAEAEVLLAAAEAALAAAAAKPASDTEAA